MTSLTSIPDIEKAGIELLKAAGFTDADSLAKARVDELAKELSKANRILGISERTPNRERVGQWIASARELTGISANDLDGNQTVLNERYTKVHAGQLDVAPFAIPLAAKFLMDHCVRVEDIPSASLLVIEASADDHQHEEISLPVIQEVREPAVVSTVRHAEAPPSRLEIDASRLRSTESLADDSKIPKTYVEQNDDRLALIRGPRVETNKGRDPKSRRFVRGVLHSHPGLLKIAASLTILLAILFPAAVISAVLLILSDLLPTHFSWVPKQLLTLPLALPVVAILYLICGSQGSCRICRQGLFLPKACRKNSKAHRVPGLGYIIPLCFHLLIYKWFRCTYCGTPVRVKE